MTREEFLLKLEAHPHVMVDFYADWCEPCKMLDKILEEVKLKIAGRATILKIDLDESSALKTEYSIMSVPTLMIFNKGELKWRMPGFMMADDLVKKIEEFV